MPKVLYVSLCWILTAIFLELVMQTVARVSPQIKFYTNNPYQQQFLDDVVDWKGLGAAALCPQPPGDLLNGFVINSKGNISPEYPYKKPQNTKRLVLIGDSHAVGAVPYPNHFSRVLEGQINVFAPYEFEVVNLGIGCIGPLVEQKILSIEGVKYNPDVVVLGFFVGNDFTDDQTYLYKHTVAKKTEKHLLPEWYFRSKLLTFFRNYLLFHTKNRHVASINQSDTNVLGVYTGDESFDSLKQSFPREEYLNIESYRSDTLVAGSQSYALVSQVKDNILNMKKISEAAGAKFLVLVIPDEMQVNAELLKAVADKRSKPIEAFDTSYPQRLLEEFFKSENIDYVDVLANWHGDPRASSYYLLNDSHLNIEGNYAIHELLYPKIVSLLSD